MPKASQKMKTPRVSQSVASLLMFSHQISGVVSTVIVYPNPSHVGVRTRKTLFSKSVKSKQKPTMATEQNTNSNSEDILSGQVDLSQPSPGSPSPPKRPRLFKGFPGTTATTKKTPNPAGLRVRSFNLEGRGGDKGKDEGQRRAGELEKHLNELHDQANAPDVILTQEDIDKEVKGYKVVAECVAEQYWCDDDGGKNYGDGCEQGKKKTERRMRNRVYVKTENQHPRLGDVSMFEDESQTFIVETSPEVFEEKPWAFKEVEDRKMEKSPVSVSMEPKKTGDQLLEYDKDESEIEAGAFNPRCAAIAVNKQTGLAFASFHLSGGSSDDVAARHWMKQHKYAPTLKQDELHLLAEYLSVENNGIHYAIAGGDTNGLTAEEAPACTEKYRNAAPEIFESVTPELWTTYQAIPDSLSLHHGSDRLARLPASNNDNSADADLVSSISSINGGVVDHFYVFQNPKSPQISPTVAVAILPVGLSMSDEGVFRRELSDHNPIEVVLSQ